MKKCNVIFLGCTQGYGYSFSACNTKVEFMARGLIELGDICIIHNGPSGKFGLTKPDYSNIMGVGTVVNYIQKGPWYVSAFLNYNQMVCDLNAFYKSEMINWVVLEAPYLPFYYLEMLAARKAGYKVAVISHEWYRTTPDSNLILRWAKYLYSSVFGFGVDAILPISEYIIRKIQKFGKPYLKVPVEADFKKTPSIKYKNKIFVYCVSAEYIRVILIVLNGFKRFILKYPSYKLVLVLGGHKTAVKNVFDVIERMNLSAYVVIKQKIPYSELFHLYETASGLVVPLDPSNKQDEARFSQKIAEYLSSGTAIISNNVGEVKHYFTNQKDLLLDEYSPEGFNRSFMWIAENPEKAVNLGHNGYELGSQFFDYRVCARELHNFFNMVM